MAQAKAIENRADDLINYLDTNMRKAGITEISCEYFTIKYEKNPPRVDVTDQDELPRDLINVKTTESPDKNSIKKRLQAGEEIKGAVLVDSKRLVIK